MDTCSLIHFANQHQTFAPPASTTWTAPVTHAQKDATSALILRPVRPVSQAISRTAPDSVRAAAAIATPVFLQHTA